jgi:hypothetical protein
MLGTLGVHLVPKAAPPCGTPTVRFSTGTAKKCTRRVTTAAWFSKTARRERQTPVRSMRRRPRARSATRLYTRGNPCCSAPGYPPPRLAPARWFPCRPRRRWPTPTRSRARRPRAFLSARGDPPRPYRRSRAAGTLGNHHLAYQHKPQNRSPPCAAGTRSRYPRCARAKT